MVRRMVNSRAEPVAVKRGERRRRTTAGFCIWGTVLISLWLPVMLPSYVTHRGWLTVVAVLALALLLGMAWISHQLAADES